MAVLCPSVNLRNIGTIAYQYILGYTLLHSETVAMDGKVIFV